MEVKDNSDKENMIWNSIHYLPQDILNKIYIENFHIKHKCDKLLEWWNYNSALKCCASWVEDLTNEILENKEGVEYLKKHNKYFERVYKQHFVDNLHPTTGFILMSKTQSLITSVLYYMWH
jgi:hypothetical protein